MIHADGFVRELHVGYHCLWVSQSAYTNVLMRELYTTGILAQWGPRYHTSGTAGAAASLLRFVRDIGLLVTLDTYTRRVRTLRRI